MSGRARRAQGLRRAGWMAVAFAVGTRLATSAGAEPPRLLDLTMKKDGENRYHLAVKIAGAPSARCRLLGTGDPGGVVLEFSGSASSLKSSYEFPDLPARAIKVTRSGAESDPLWRVEIPLAGASIQAWEIGANGLELTLSSSSSPADPAQSGESYLLGVGDRLELSVFGHDDLKKNIEVLADGTVILPLVGVMPVAGRNLFSLREELQKKLGEYLVEPQVSLDIQEYRSQPVSVVGEVEKPGLYFLKGPTTLMDMVATAGWLTHEAGNEIVITRHEKGPNGDDQTRQVVVRKEELIRGGAQNNPRLMSGDVVTVGPRQFFYIRGEVTHPGQYPLGEHPTLLKAVSIAEGLTPYARKRGIEIIRTVEGAQTKLEFDLKAIEERKAEDVPLLPGDVINVPRRRF